MDKDFIYSSDIGKLIIKSEEIDMEITESIKNFKKKINEVDKILKILKIYEKELPKIIKESFYK